MLLQLNDVEVMIGSVQALRGFSMTVDASEMTALAGRNGAGKTTVMRSIMGLVKTTGGSLSFDGEDLAKVPVHHRARLGIGYMPEDRALVPELTVAENILLPSWVTPTIDGPKRLKQVWEIMPELYGMKDRRALQLSGGQQKMVALGRALTVGTRLLLLDEPFEGVAPALAQRLADVIAELRKEKLAVILSQSELNHAFSLFDSEWIIERGSNAASREAAE
ncbi:Branched-chain amino acid transport ATP-binding protein LivF [Caenispirillum salinarum AK4]|uniref:Branched-chain amino acid transport ATP-binding protein LivF n=1 Tax=Caenispirillum salinarum AK4 TaxID=1238182 RepID=K9GSE7_9PROT|nr:ATP-binding cassette domain-containing protein [Caenispirillum salinarum]EKV27634.1 Branched-chain amino acid transport ATP-binding protein LivF [Caenispirillum salinarum AK4]